MTADLKLPEWLKAAAAETPHDPNVNRADGVQRPPAGFVVQSAKDATNEAADAPPEQPIVANPRADAAKPRAAGPQPIPDWMRASVPPHAQAPASADVSDTSSFITESDLPEWIRQIADADAAKRFEDQRLAAEAEQAAAVEAIGGKRIPLPGETTTAGYATNPWLSRREKATATDAWTGASARETAEETPPVVEPSVIPTEPAAPQPAVTSSDSSTGVGKKRGRFSMRALPQAKEPNPAKPAKERSSLALPKRALPSAGTGDHQSTMRLALIGAIVLLLLIVFATVVL